MFLQVEQMFGVILTSMMIKLNCNLQIVPLYLNKTTKDLWKL